MAHFTHVTRLAGLLLLQVGCCVAAAPRVWEGEAWEPRSHELRPHLPVAARGGYSVAVLDRDPVLDTSSLISRVNGSSAFNYTFNTAWFSSPPGALHPDGLVVRVVECNANHHSCAGVGHPEWTNAGALAVVGASLGGGAAGRLTAQPVNISAVSWVGAAAPPHGGTAGLWGAADPRIAYRGATGEYFLTWDNCTQNCFPHRTTMLSTTRNPFDPEGWTFRGPLLGPDAPYTGGASLLLRDQPPHYAFVSNSDTANAINVATSSDGYTWAFNASDKSPWMEGRAGMWDASGVAPGPQPERLSTGDLLFVYNIDTGFPYKPSYLGRCSIGWAILDGENPMHIVARADAPLLTPLLSWETCGGEGGKGAWPLCQEPEVVFATGMKPLGGDEFLVVYGGADSVVGVARIGVTTAVGGGGLSPAGGAAGSVELRGCAGSDASQAWTLQPTGSAGAVRVAAADGSACLATANCSAPVSLEDVVLEACGNARCPGSGNQGWVWAAGTGFLASALPTPPGGSVVCLTLSGVTGPGVNLWPCELNSSSWDVPPLNEAGAIVSREGGAAAHGCLSRAPSPTSVIVVNASVPGRKFDGIGGLAAIGGARLLYEYPEPTRSHILDLLFSPHVGAAFQLLKTEIEGDVDSSYGSGPSYRHTADPSSISFNRGIYLPWLVQEAKRRNPALVLYSLSWGVPAWVGNGSGYFSADNVQYHVDYLVGARDVWGTVYAATGVWNERPFTRQWVRALRAGLDAANLTQTKIILNDAADSGCGDCPPAWGTSVHAALANDPDFRAAVGGVGFHSGDVEGLAPLPGEWEEYGLTLWQSESNIADGPMPQWEADEGNVYGTGLSWPRVFLANYIRARATATILCPIAHSFTWNYGRENHGIMQVVEPWSGYYELGAGFWGQAQFTQFTAPGWRFLDGTGSGQFCTSGEDGSCYLLWASLLSPSGTDFTLLAVNTQPDGSPPLNLTFLLTGPELVGLQSTSLSVWRTRRDAYFLPLSDARVDALGFLNVSLPPRTVTTFTTLRTGSHAGGVPPSPARAPFPLPFATAFDGERVEEPGRLLSDLYGTFYVRAAPGRGGGKQALWQAVPVNPGANAWMPDGVPFTSLPAGTNWANANVSIDVYLAAAEVGASGAALTYLCGRVPIWHPTNWAGPFAWGICLSISRDGGSGGWSWTLADNQPHSSVVLATGALPGDPLDAWRTLRLVFDDDRVTAYLDGAEVGAGTHLRASSGVAGFGSGWHTAWYDALTLDAAAGHPRRPSSWLYDLLPGEVVRTNVTGWAGMALDLTAAPACVPTPGTVMQPLTLTAVGRFKSAGNAGVHRMDVVRASDGASMLPGGAPVSVDMSDAGCNGGGGTDVLGFCYSPPLPGRAAVTLPVGDVYYIVSEEGGGAGADGVREMTSPAKGTMHASGKRDGVTYMSYAGPTLGCVAGRVYKPTSGGGGGEAWVLTPDLDTAFGPVNVLLG